MPTYEYECSHCGHTFERFQGINDEPVKRCPSCRHKVKRLFGTGSGIIFKGSGFYETDYRRSATSKKEDAVTPAKESTKTADASKGSDSAAKD